MLIHGDGKMKAAPLFCLLIFCASFAGSHSQDKFYLLKAESYHYPQWTDGSSYNFTLEDVFKDPSETYYMIGPEAFDSTVTSDFSKLVNVETICIPVGILSDQPDSERVAFVNKVKRSTSRLSCLSKCPKLKRIVFLIGIGTFTTEKQSEPLGNEEKWGVRYDQRQTALELELGWEAFGRNVHQQLPGIKLYGAVEYW